MNAAIKDCTGQRFGRLLVVAFHGSPDGNALWLCRCDCGSERVCHGTALRNGHTTSCGCLRTEHLNRIRRTTHFKHGLAGTPVARVWEAMIRRCEVPAANSYPGYGGRGITVCQRWRESLAAFSEDMGPRPPGATIEREDNDKGYEPGNCVWADATTQANNTRRSRRITHDGRTMTLAQWAREAGLDPSALRLRIKRGWPFARAIVEPLRQTARGGRDAR